MRKAQDTHINFGSPERTLWAEVIAEANYCVHREKVKNPKTRGAKNRANQIERDRGNATRFFRNYPTSCFGFACEVLGVDARKVGEAAMQGRFDITAS